MTRIAWKTSSCSLHFQWWFKFLKKNARLAQKCYFYQKTTNKPSWKHFNPFRTIRFLLIDYCSFYDILHNFLSWTHCFLFCVHSISRSPDNFGDTGVPIVLKGKRPAWYLWNWWLNKKWNICQNLQILFQESIN